MPAVATVRWPNHMRRVMGRRGINFADLAVQCKRVREETPELAPLGRGELTRGDLWRCAEGWFVPCADTMFIIAAALRTDVRDLFFDEQLLPNIGGARRQ